LDDSEIREQSCSARVRPRAAQARCLRYLKSLLPSVYDLALVPIVCYIAVDSLMMVQFIDPWAVGLYCAAAGVILLLVRIIRYFLQQTVYVEPVDTLLTGAEQRFYEALDTAIDGRLLILSKVRIADLFHVTSASNSAKHRVFRSIACKHVDFVLAEADNLRPLVAIELDDPSHQRTDRRLRDKLLNDLFQKAAFPLLRFRTAAAYNPRMIEERLEQVVRI